MKYRVELTSRALEDVENAVGYLQQHAAESTVANWYDRLLATVESLAENPQRCPKAAESERMGIDLREILFGKRRGVFRILFTIESKSVRIHTIRHAARRMLDEE